MSSYVNTPRTPLNQTLQKVYNPATVKEHPAPWPMQKTNFDIDLQQIWCPDCGKAIIPDKVPNLNLFSENYICPEMSLPNRFR